MFIIAITYFVAITSVQAQSCNYTQDDNPWTVNPLQITCWQLNESTVYLDEMYRIFSQVPLSSDKIYLQIENSNLPEIGEWITLPFGDNHRELQSLTITNSQVQTVSNSVFERFSSVTRLDLSHNYLKEASFINQLKFSYIFLNNNNFSNTFNLSTVKDSYIITLDLSNNRINKYVADSAVIQTLNLSNNKLEKEFEVSSRISTLDLSYNNINNYIETYAITKLNLSYNRNLASVILKTLDNRQLALNGNNNLKEIMSTDGSKLRMMLELSNLNTNILTTNFFDEVTVINTLNLTNTNLQSLQKSTFNIAKFIEMDGITIDLSHSNLSDIEEYYFTEYNIRSLNLSGNYLNSLKNNTFSAFKLENELILSNSGITTIEKEAFYNVSTRKLSLSNNGIANITFFNNITVNELNLSNNPISYIDQNSFSNCLGLNILRLSNCFIETISTSSLSELKSLKQLEISFRDGFSAEMINNIYLEKLYIVNSSLSLESNNFKGLYNLKELHFNNSEIKNLDKKSLKGLYNLQYLDANQLFKLISIVPSKVFEDLANVKQLNLSFLNLQTIESEAFVGLRTLTELYLNDNQIDSIPASSLKGLENLQILHIENNKLKASLEPGVCQSLTNLEELYLNGNDITNIRTGTFEGLSSLQVLDLSNNLLTNSIIVPFMFPLKSLKTLYLDSNRLSAIVSYELLFNSLSNLKIIGLGNNPWSCTYLANLLYELRKRTIESTFYNVQPEYSLLNINGVTCS